MKPSKSGKYFEKYRNKSVIGKLESNFVDSGNSLRTFIYPKSSGQVYVESILTEYKGRRAYQTYVILDDQTSEPMKFAVNGFPYYETKKQLVKDNSYSPNCLLTRIHSVWVK